MKLNPRDIGFAIRDHLEGHAVTAFVEDKDGDLTEDGQTTVDFVDISDPDSLIVYVNNGQRFGVRISRHL